MAEDEFHSLKILAAFTVTYEFFFHKDTNQNSFEI